MRKKIAIILILLLIAACLTSFFGCAEEEPINTPEIPPEEPPTESTEDPSGGLTEEEYPYTFGVLNPNDPIVEITLSNGDSIRLELFPWLAPKTVENFLVYVNEGFYEGTAFHRIIRDFMVQTGGFEQKNDVLSKKAATHPTIQGEFISNDFYHSDDEEDPWVKWTINYDLYLAHTPGVLSMARTNAANSASTEFFICSATYNYGNGRYAAFGRVIDMQSMNAVLRLEKMQTGTEDLYYGEAHDPSDNVPLQKVFITSATVLENYEDGSAILPSQVPWFTIPKNS